MSEWGKGVLNNNIGWGQGFNNTINWGAIYASSYRGQTIISEILNLQSIIDNFKIRVANDGGTFEAESNLLSILTAVNDTIGLSNINMLLTPNAFKATKAYNVIGITDFAVLRNTNATRINVNNLIANSAANIMRINYVSGTPTILDEIQRTNLLAFNQQVNESRWAKLNGATVTANSVASPNGTIDADTLNFSNVTNSRIEQQVSLSVTGDYTFSVYLRSDSNKQVAFRIGFSGSSFTTLNVTTVWTRFVVTQSLASAGNANPQINSIDTSGGSVYVWGAQLELGSFASSLITTDSAAVTRNEDVLTVTPPVGTVRITTTFFDNSSQVLNTIPATFTLPTGQIRQVVFQNSL